MKGLLETFVTGLGAFVSRLSVVGQIPRCLGCFLAGAASVFVVIVYIWLTMLP
jgi:hypothetical protein